MYGLKSLVPHYQQALSEILDQDWMEGSSDNHVEEVYSAASELYGLIHARFITTPMGLDDMNKRFARATFGRCPRVLCQNQAVLPMGLSDEPKKSNVKLYCPRCNGIFDPPHKPHRTIDGAHFGTTMAHLLLLEFPHTTAPVVNFQPKVFGFKLRDESKCVIRSGAPAQPRMQLLTGVSTGGPAHPVVDGKY
jgi:casein kinase II subunit beta